jgi:hypothetical protein
MDNRVALQLERLYRNYLSARAAYDPIAFYELTHTLRVWTEIADNKEALESWYNKALFRCAKPSKKMSKLLARHECEYIWLYSAHYNHGEIIQISLFLPTDIQFKGTIVSVGSQISPAKNAGLNGLRGYYLGTKIEGLNVKNIELSNKLNLTQFLGGEIVSIRYSGIRERFSAKYIIQRAANDLTDSSHFQKNCEITTERLSGVIPLLSAASIGNISFLYFFILYISQEILIAFNRIERINN